MPDPAPVTVREANAADIPAVLGLYERTTRLLLMPINTINAPVYAAAMPALFLSPIRMAYSGANCAATGKWGMGISGN